MAISRLLIREALKKPYDGLIFAKSVFSLVFGFGFSLILSSVLAPLVPNASESKAIVVMEKLIGLKLI